MGGDRRPRQSFQRGDHSGGIGQAGAGGQGGFPDHAIGGVLQGQGQTAGNSPFRIEQEGEADDGARRCGQSLGQIRVRTVRFRLGEQQVHHDDGGVGVELVDDGRGAHPVPGPANGLDGLAERVAAAEGEFEAGEAPGGGFRLAVRVPQR